MPKQRDWWCRLYSEVVDDDKLTWVADAAAVSRVIVLGVWAGLLALANRSPERGTLLIADGTPYPLPLLAKKLDVDEGDLESILSAMQTVGLLSGNPHHVVAFDKRNPSSDDATKRQQEHRESKAEDVTDMSRDNVVTCHNVVTPGSISNSISQEGEGDCKGEGVKAPSKRAKKPPGTPPRDAVALRALFAALSSVCGVDPAVKRNRGKLNKAAAELYDAGRRGEDVQAFGTWWRLNDWRGKKGQRPAIGQLLEGIGRPGEAHEPGSATTLDLSRYMPGGELSYLFEDERGEPVRLPGKED